MTPPQHQQRENAFDSHLTGGEEKLGVKTELVSAEETDDKEPKWLVSEPRLLEALLCSEACTHSRSTCSESSITLRTEGERSVTPGTKTHPQKKKGKKEE